MLARAAADRWQVDPAGCSAANGTVANPTAVLLPGMKFATPGQSPVFGGRVKHVDAAAAKKVPGVRQVVVLDDLIAIVGDHMWAAEKGFDALVVTSQIVISGTTRRTPASIILMPAFGSIYSNTEIAAVVNYLTKR